ncbi:uncharacterized protein LOC119167752 isoform X1 [Rhipicephalus microplus]|uniref:uncharacterized protein LOC119167752 isoform X1 n=1 Tax=Rhipicephalus microplus TaxID=6941 RepID=UPI003F6D9F6D
MCLEKTAGAPRGCSASDCPYQIGGGIYAYAVATLSWKTTNAIPCLCGDVKRHPLKSDALPSLFLLVEKKLQPFPHHTLPQKSVGECGTVLVPSASQATTQKNSAQGSHEYSGNSEDHGMPVRRQQLPSPQNPQYGHSVVLHHMSSSSSFSRCCFSATAPRGFRTLGGSTPVRMDESSPAKKSSC